MNLNDVSRAEDDLRRALAGGDEEVIASVILANAWPLFSARYDLLSSAVAALPSALVERNPVLRVLHPMTPVLSRTTRPYKPLLYADQARTYSPDELDALTLAQMIAFRMSGDIESALTYARRLEDRIIQTRVESRERTDGPLWFYHHQIGSTLLAAGDSSRALLEFATARQLARFALQEDAERVALGRTALAHAARGSLDDAARILSDVATRPTPTSAHASSCLSTERAAAALISVDRLSNDMDDRIAALESYDSVELTWPFALLARSRALLAAHRPDDALETIRLAEAAHPPQSASFAADVLASAAIEALIELGDIRRARATATSAAAAGAGLLTSLATIRLCLHEGDSDAAMRLAHAVGADRSLGPAQRAEFVLLTAWLEFARTGSVDRTVAVHVSRLGTNPDSRRLFASLPRQLVERVRQQLPADSVASFDGVVGGLAQAEFESQPQLTRSELRILRALTEFDTTAMIAEAFHVSPNTVKSQLQSLYRKLGCSTREDALRLATRAHLVSPAPGGGMTFEERALA